MITFRYDLTTYRRFLTEIADMLGTSLQDGVLLLPASAGEGWMKLIELDNELEAVVFDIRLKEDWLLERNSNEKEFYMLLCEELTGVAESFIEIGQERMELTGEDRMAMYLTSFMYDVRYYIKAGAHVRSLRLMLPEQWLVQYLNLEEKKHILEKYIQMKTAGIWFKRVDAETKEVMNELLIPGSSENLLYYQVRILRLVEKFFGSLHHDLQLLPKASGISRQDIEKILKVERMISADPSTPPPTIPELAKKAGLSESKMKKLFRNIYGLPPYEYFQRLRMQKARHMLMSGKYSVKDVGYALGYSNLSNFTLAFKKEYGELPSSLLQKTG